MYTFIDIIAFHGKFKVEFGAFLLQFVELLMESLESLGMLLLHEQDRALRIPQFYLNGGRHFIDTLKKVRERKITLKFSSTG